MAVQCIVAPRCQRRSRSVPNEPDRVGHGAYAPIRIAILAAMMPNSGLMIRLCRAEWWHSSISVIAEAESKPMSGLSNTAKIEHAPQVGAPDPERRNSPIQTDPAQSFELMREQVGD